MRYLILGFRGPLIALGVCACVALFSASAWALAVNPWVQSDAKVSAGQAEPNIFSMEAFHASPAFKGLAPKEFCRKLFELYYDGRRKNWGEYQEGLALWAHTAQEPHANEKLIELDPVVLLNVHGTGYCGIQSGLLEGIYQSRPGGAPGKPAIEARRWFLAGIVHSVCDAFYDGKWHYYDIDIGGYAGDADKDVWSVADVIADPKGYYGAKTTLRAPYFFGADAKGAWVEQIKKEGSYAFQDNLMLGHEMTFALRKGERFTRHFSKDAAGWAEFPPYTRPETESAKANCELIYEPTPKDLEAEALAKVDGKLIVPVRLPYNITSSKVEADGLVSVSYDLGKSWTDLDKDGVIKDAPNRWDFLLRVEPGKLKKITTRGLVHAGSLPRVGAQGPTNMTVTDTAPYQTLTWVPDWSSAEKFNSCAKATGLTYKADASRPGFTGGGLEGAGEVVIPVKAPPGAKLVKLSACVIGGTGATPNPNNFIELHIGPAGQSKLVERTTDCSPWGLNPATKVEHWQNNVNGSATLEPCAEGEVKVACKGYGVVLGLRIYAHYVPEKPAPVSGTLTITHGYDGQNFSKEVDLAALAKAPVTYAVPAAAKKNTFIKMEVK